MSLDTSGLRGKRVLITGASRGIGEEAARAFAAAGAQLGLAARSDTAIHSLAQELDALPLVVDVAHYAQLTDAVSTMNERFGGVDVLINNAAVIDPIGLIARTDPDAWSTLIDINVKGVMHGMRAVLPQMVSARAGTIITVGSGAAHNPLEGWSGYCASKAAAWMLTRVADIEARAAGVRVMSLSPGTVATDMQRQIRDSGINPVSQLDWSAHIPPEWAAQALVWMCTPDADDWTGREVSLREPAVRRRIGLDA